MIRRPSATTILRQSQQHAPARTTIRSTYIGQEILPPPDMAILARVIKEWTTDVYDVGSLLSNAGHAYGQPRDAHAVAWCVLGYLGRVTSEDAYDRIRNYVATFCPQEECGRLRLVDINDYDSHAATLVIFQQVLAQARLTRDAVLHGHA